MFLLVYYYFLHFPFCIGNVTALYCDEHTMAVFLNFIFSHATSGVLKEAGKNPILYQRPLY